jgi:predicted DNA-binding transcriptional regulator AlpA
MLLSKRQVAERLGVTERTVDLWIARGLIDRPIKLGAAQQSRVRFPADTVDNVARRLAAAHTSTASAA